jgi:Tfp pilus assembly protein PilV
MVSKQQTGFFVIELMVGFLLLQTMILVAAGYLSYQTKLYHACMQRLIALELANEAIERCWPKQCIPQAQVVQQYTCTYEPLAIKAYPKFKYGVYTVRYDSPQQQKSVALAVGCMEVTAV